MYHIVLLSSAAILPLSFSPSLSEAGYLSSIVIYERMHTAVFLAE